MRTVLAAMLGFGLVVSAACGGKQESDGGGGKKESDGGETAVKWPQRPADGTPVVLDVPLVEPNKKGNLQVRVPIFNFSDKDITRIVVTLDYIDASGKKLQEGIPSTIGGTDGPVIAAKGTKTQWLGSLPLEAKKVEAHVQSVEFADKSKWEAPAK